VIVFLCLLSPVHSSVGLPDAFWPVPLHPPHGGEWSACGSSKRRSFSLGRTFTRPPIFFFLDAFLSRAPRRLPLTLSSHFLESLHTPPKCCNRFGGFFFFFCSFFPPAFGFSVVKFHCFYNFLCCSDADAPGGFFALLAPPSFGQFPSPFLGRPKSFLNFLTFFCVRPFFSPPPGLRFRPLLLMFPKVSFSHAFFFFLFIILNNEDSPFFFN